MGNPNLEALAEAVAAYVRARGTLSIGQHAGADRPGRPAQRKRR
jgi:hypothetical protein